MFSLFYVLNYEDVGIIEHTHRIHAALQGLHPHNADQTSAVFTLSDVLYLYYTCPPKSTLISLYAE